MRNVCIGMILLLTIVIPVFAQGDPTPVAPPFDVELPIEGLAYTADFTDTTIWAEGTAQQALSFGPTDSGFAVVSTDSEAGVGIAPTAPEVFDNFYTEFTFSLDTCNSDSSALLFSAGLDADASDPTSAGQYVFVVQCDGNYRSRPLINGQAGAVDRRSRTVAPLTVGADYTMGVLVDGDIIGWFLDGAELGRYRTPAAPESGSLAFGGQLGIGYTVTSWHVWDIESGVFGSSGSESLAEDPLADGGIGEILFNPDFQPPTDLTYGLHYPVARYINSNGLVMFNNDDVAIMPIPQVNQADYYFELNYVVRSCGDDSLTGLIWRASDDLGSFYVFGVECDGSYRVRSVVDGEAGDVLLEGDVAVAPDNEQLVSISVFARGEQAWIYYNRQLLGSITDQSLADGMAGILLQSSTSGVKMDMIVTDIGILAVEPE